MEIVDLMLRREQVLTLLKSIKDRGAYYDGRMTWRAEEVLYKELLRVEAEIEKVLLPKSSDKPLKYSRV